MQEVRYVTTFKPIKVCPPERPQESLKEKKKIIYFEGQVSSLGTDMKSIKKKLKNPEY